MFGNRTQVIHHPWHELCSLFLAYICSIIFLLDRIPHATLLPVCNHQFYSLTHPYHYCDSQEPQHTCSCIVYHSIPHSNTLPCWGVTINPYCTIPYIAFYNLHCSSLMISFICFFLFLHFFLIYLQVWTQDLDSMIMILLRENVICLRIKPEWQALTSQFLPLQLFNHIFIAPCTSYYITCCLQLWIKLTNVSASLL